jgi:hypothetical protein
MLSDVLKWTMQSCLEVSKSGKVLSSKSSQHQCDDEQPSIRRQMIVFLLAVVGLSGRKPILSIPAKLKPSRLFETGTAETRPNWPNAGPQLRPDAKESVNEKARRARV